MTQSVGTSKGLRLYCCPRSSPNGMEVDTFSPALPLRCEKETRPVIRGQRGMYREGQNTQTGNKNLPKSAKGTLYPTLRDSTYVIRAKRCEGFSGLPYDVNRVSKSPTVQMANEVTTKGQLGSHTLVSPE